MGYLVRIRKEGEVIGQKIVSDPQPGFLAETIHEIMLPVRQMAGGFVGDYHISVTDYPDP
jgi:hypothetical protein